MIKKLESEDKFEEQAPERPIECTECKRSLAVWYTEIVGNNISQTSMCEECPVLHKKLHSQDSAKSRLETSGEATVTCGECGTSLSDLRVGNLLGCSNCYEIFSDIIFNELVSVDKIPQRLSVNLKRNAPIHIGRGPSEIAEISSSLRLLSLNDALNETLQKEDYEQAAWLRDQIKALKEESTEGESNDK